MIKSLVTAASLILATSSFAAVKVVSNDNSPNDAIAVSSACIVNTTDYVIGLDHQWGPLEGQWMRSFLSPGDSILYRLVLEEANPEMVLNLRFAASPTTREGVIQEVATMAGTVREDDCAKVAQYDFALTETNGGDEIFAISPHAPNDGGNGNTGN